MARVPPRTYGPGHGGRRRQDTRRLDGPPWQAGRRWGRGVGATGRPLLRLLPLLPRGGVWTAAARHRPARRARPPHRDRRIRCGAARPPGGPRLCGRPAGACLRHPHRSDGDRPDRRGHAGRVRGPHRRPGGRGPAARVGRGAAAGRPGRRRLEVGSAGVPPGDLGRPGLRSCHLSGGHRAGNRPLRRPGQGLEPPERPEARPDRGGTPLPSPWPCQKPAGAGVRRPPRTGEDRSGGGGRHRQQASSSLLTGLGARPTGGFVELVLARPAGG
jgi:hypothetical protein